MRTLYIFTLFALLAVPFAGCGPTGPETYDVSGTVALDGEPVESGNIVFRDVAGKDKSYGGKVTNGQFSFESSPGEKKVEITAMREVPGEVDTSNPGEEAPVLEQYIPEQYNAESTLTVEVTGAEKFDFDLKS